jgi:hypothetical protein
MFYDDDGSLDTYLRSLADPLFQEVEDWASDGDDGSPGYSILVDPDRVPTEGIPWLGQFVGVTITSGLSDADQRVQLIGLGNWKRGTVAALEAAVKPLLTGSQTIVVKERDTSPYHFEVYTLASETVDINKARAALLTQKPAGLVMNYFTYSGQKAFTIGGGSALRGTPPDALRLVI